MANRKNLVPNSNRTPRERRENAKKAGIASGKARREKAVFRRAFEALMDIEVPVPSLKDQLEALGIDPNGANALAFTAFRTALISGDIKAIMEMRKILGEDKIDEDKGQGVTVITGEEALE